MKARLNPLKRLRWWWITRTYELNAAETTTFWEWLNANDLALCTWKMVEDGDSHTHDLVQLEMESTETVLQQYLRHLKGGT